MREEQPGATDEPTRQHQASFEEWFETSVIHPIEDFRDPRQEWPRGAGYGFRSDGTSRFSSRCEARTDWSWLSSVGASPTRL